jgi:hypothetical protein
MTDLVPCSSSSSRNSVLSYALSASMHLGRFTRRIRRSATGQSCASPPVNRMAIRRPLVSASAWIFVLRPPRERPTACFCSPLLRRLLTGGRSRAWSRSSASLWISRSRQVPEKGFPRCRAAPSEQNCYDRRRRTIFGRTIAPAATAFQHMHNAADNAPIVHSLDTSRIRWQMGLDALPLLNAQPKQIPSHDPDPPKRIRSVWNQDCFATAPKLTSSHPSTEHVLDTSPNLALFVVRAFLRLRLRVAR